MSARWVLLFALLMTPAVVLAVNFPQDSYAPVAGALGMVAMLCIAVYVRFFKHRK